MTPEYVPILKAKKGEFDALSHLDKSTSARFLPLFELPRLTDATRNSVRFSNSSDVTASYLDELAEKISSVRQGMSCHVDIWSWAPNSTTDKGEHVLSYTHERLMSSGVLVYPIIGYDRWDDVEYQRALSTLRLSTNTRYCIRLDSDAIEDLDDEEYFLDRIHDILTRLAIEPSSCSILVDFRDVISRSVIDLQEDIDKVIAALRSIPFLYISVAGCSLSANIADAVSEINSTGMVLRKEMIAWQASKKANPSLPLIFGDYGIRNPNAAEDVIAPHANGKIRYTIADQYFVVRGHSIQHEDKGAQYHRLSQQLIDSPHFIDAQFSWGDSRIAKCSRREVGPGNATTWIAVDTNHHIKTVLMEIFEFRRQISQLRTTVLNR